jgi:hypothetical protein
MEFANGFGDSPVAVSLQNVDPSLFYSMNRMVALHTGCDEFSLSSSRRSRASVLLGTTGI